MRRPTTRRPGRPGTLRIALGFRSCQIGLALLGLLVGIAVLGPVVAPHGTTEVVGVPFAGPSGSHPMGTDVLGRDVLSRFLHGGLTMIFLPLIATILGFLIGVALGLVAGYRRGATDSVSMRLVDIVLSFPAIVLVLLLMTGLGAKVTVLVVGVAITTFPGVARIVRGATQEVVTKEFIEAAELRGEGDRWILLREVLPNIWSPTIAAFGVYLPTSVVLIASLSYLGFGLQPPAADWALMINENASVLESEPMVLVAPILALAVLTIAVNLVGDAIARAAGRSTTVGRRRRDAVAILTPTTEEGTR